MPNFHKIFIVSIAFLCLVALPQTVFAQSEQQPADFNERLEIAKQVQALQPVAGVVEATIRSLALRYPADQRESFIRGVAQAVDIRAVEQDAVKVMAETFTLNELKVLYAYRSSKEGQAIKEKTPIYQTLVERNLFKHLDRALIQVKTGAPSDK